MDAFLDVLGFYRSDVAKDGSSLFRVVSEQLFYTQVHHSKIRQKCVEYMRRNRRLFEPLVNEDYDGYLDKIKEEKEWVGEVEMKALSSKYKIDFVVYNDTTKPPLKIQVSSPIKTIVLANNGGNCYDCVYSKSMLSALAFCQALVYEVLYKEVFELGSDVDIAVEKMLHDKAYSKQRRNNLLCHLFKENCRIDGVSDNHNLPEDDQATHKDPRLEIRKALAQGVPPFPYKVAKTLDPGIYRNVEFDMWNEKRKEDHKSEQFIIPKLEPGVRCKVHINKEIYVGHIQDIFNGDENVSIYIEELCKRCVVSTSVLEIVPVPAYKALTWQGGKTYKVYSESTTSGNDPEKLKYKKGMKRNYQEYSPSRNSSGGANKPNAIIRCNSFPSSSLQQPNFIRNNSFHCPSQHRRRGHLTSTPIPNKGRTQSVQDYHNGYSSGHSPVNIPVVLNGVDPNLTLNHTSQFKMCDSLKGAFDPYGALPESPENVNELNDSGWSEDSLKQSTLSPPHYTVASVYSEDAGYSSLSMNSFNSGGPSSSATSLPLPIPGAPPILPLPEEVSPSQYQPSPCAPQMAVYQYPVYAVPSMYLVCRDGSSVPVSIGAWGAQEACNGEVAPGVPSMIFNTPPTGMSPPVASWIPASVANIGHSWTPAISSTVAFTPPLELNAYQPIMSPPWSPQSGIYVPPPAAVAYHPIPPPVPPRMMPQEPAQN